MMHVSFILLITSFQYSCEDNFQQGTSRTSHARTTPGSSTNTVLNMSTGTTNMWQKNLHITRMTFKSTFNVTPVPIVTTRTRNQNEAAATESLASDSPTLYSTREAPFKSYQTYPISPVHSRETSSIDTVHSHGGSPVTATNV